MLAKPKSERLIWLDIMLTLLPLEIMAYFYYGVKIVAVSLCCIAVSLAAELVVLRLRSRKFTADDLSCTSDALIISLMMPAAIGVGIPAAGCVFAVLIIRNLFGGRRNMIFSPAAVGYLFILTSWKDELLMYPRTYARTGLFKEAEELVHSASHTFNTTGKLDISDFELLMGSFPGPVGAVSVLLLAVVAAVLIFRRDISGGAFLGTILGMAFMAYVCPVTDIAADSVKYMLATNMTLFAAIYIISDKRIAPEKNYYAFFYGLLISVLSYVITITTGKENVIIIMSVLFTPLALVIRTLEERIDAERRRELENRVKMQADTPEEGAESNG